MYSPAQAQVLLLWGLRPGSPTAPSGGSEVARDEWWLLQFKTLALVSRAGQGLSVRRQTRFCALMLSHRHLLLGAKVPKEIPSIRNRSEELPCGGPAGEERCSPSHLMCFQPYSGASSP